MKLHSYKKVFLCFTVMAIFTLAGCGDVKTTKKVNTFLQENGWEKIHIGSKEDINSQLFDILLKHDFGLGNGIQEQREQRQIRVAEFIVENGFYGTAKKFISSYPYLGWRSFELILWIAIMTDAISEKNTEAIEFLNFFHQEIIGKDYEQELDYYFSFLILYEEAPEIFEKINYGGYRNSWIRPKEAIVRAVIQSSKKFKKAITEQLTIREAFPLSIAENLFANFKPSNPKKGKYLLVFDNTTHKLYKTRADTSDYFTRTVFKKDISLYEAGILQPANKLNEAQIIIYETYSYQQPNGYWFGYVYLVRTNVKVVNAVTGKTIFNKTFKSTGDESYLGTGDYILDDDYSAKEYVKQILEIVKKAL
ncbi:MAG: hypothetical protein LBL90_11135 [Prevotellaceae bacterium]|jgi:hypothetical protein|nr:hypothetical protein [Prevotellaceae bacterium]